MEISGNGPNSGVALTIPDEWFGQVVTTKTGGWIVQASNLAGGSIADALGTQLASRLEGDDVLITVFSLGPLPEDWLTSENGWFFTDGPVTIGKGDFGAFEGITAPSYALSNVVYRGQAIEIGAGFGTANPSHGDLARVNTILSSLKVPPPSGEAPVIGTRADEAVAHGSSYRRRHRWCAAQL
jgi:hypothetical protein